MKRYSLSLFLSLLLCSSALAGVKPPDKPKPKGDPRAAFKNLGKIKSAQEVLKKLKTDAARKPIDKVTK